MFTGLVEKLLPVTEVIPEGPGRRIIVSDAELAADAALGDSIAINGCCLTVVSLEGERLSFEAGPETLQRTNLGLLTAGTPVNVERSLRLGDRIGGHLVTGHIDGVGSLEQRLDDEQWATCWFRMPAELGRQMASKGSIAIDGVSLTLCDVEPERFSVMLIPHTLAVTTIGTLKPGSPVNLETDLLAKYVQKQLATTPLGPGQC